MTLRSRLSLDGSWHFWADPQSNLTRDALNVDVARSVNVPAPWQSQGPDLVHYTGIAWYHRTFELAPDRLGGRVVLGFGAVDDRAEIWFNDVKVGEHEGGYLPFEFDVTAHAREGVNTLVVRVEDTLLAQPEIPHGKQSWYGALSGLWQSVWIEGRADVHLLTARVTPRLADGVVDVALTTNRSLVDGQIVRFAISDPAGAVCAQAEATGLNAVLQVPEPLPWDVDTPRLYTLQITLCAADATPSDTLTETFGFRTIATENGRLLLNGRPIYLRGALDQDYYPDTICTPPSDAFIEDQFRKAKAMGLNCLRLHIKVGDPRYYAAADRIGLLIWSELPNWSLLTDETRRRAQTTVAGMVARDWNHPSLIIWTLINESWGVDLTNPEHRAWLSDAYDSLKALDPQRLVVGNSACWGNFHVVTDIEDFHNYYAIPDHYTEWRDWVANFAGRAHWAYAQAYPGIEAWRAYQRDPWHSTPRPPAPEVRRRGDEPLVVSEFGNWGLPDVDALLAKYGGQEPWWFESGHTWGDGVVYPHAVQQRFQDHHFARAFPTLAALAEASQHMQLLALKYQIEQMRLQPNLQGYIITEFTDVHWECNGLLDMQRTPKTHFAALADLNADDLVVPTTSRAAYWSGEDCAIDLTLSHYSNHDLTGARLSWAVDGHPDLQGEWSVSSAAAPSVQPVGRIAFSAPGLARPARLIVRWAMTTAQGMPVARNTETVYVFPRLSAPLNARVYAPELGPDLAALGCTVVTDLAGAEIAVVTTLTDALRAYVLAGGRVLWLAETPESLQTHLPGVSVRERHGQPWQGDWASSFSWLNQDRLFADIPTEGLLDFAFADLTPDCVLTGFGPNDFATHVHAGLTVGWLHKTVALIAERSLGRGHLLISTLRLSRALPHHPVAQALVAEMLRHLQSPA